MFKDNTRWKTILWLFLIGVLAYMDRTNFSISVPLLMEEFALDSGQIGLIMSAFTIGYTIFNIPGGFLAHKFGGKKTLVGVVLFWSIMTAVTGLAFSFASLVVIRVVFGIFEGPHYPATSAVADQWIKPKERGLANGLWIASLPVGIVVGNLVSAYIVSTFGWRFVFYAFGALGLIVAWLTYIIIYDRPSVHPTVSKAEVDAIAEANKIAHAAAGTSTSDMSSMTFVKLISNPWSWCMLLVMFASGIVYWGNLNWLPTYFMKARGYNLVAAGFFSSIPWVLFFVGVLSMGGISDWAKIGRAPWLIIVALIQIPCIIYAVLTPDITTCLVMFCIAQFCSAATLPLCWSLVFEIFARVDGPKVGGMMMMGSSIGGIIAPTLMGFVLKSTGSFNIAYYVFAGCCAISAIIAAILTVKERSVIKKKLAPA